MKMCKLKNGSEEAQVLVNATMMHINDLMKSLPGALDLYELVAKCRDPGHKMFGDSAKHLEERGLLEPGERVHGSIRNIVLSSAAGTDYDLHFENPEISK